METKPNIKLAAVTKSEVAGHAKKRCSNCYGTGFYIAVEKTGNTKKICNCALRRYIKVTPGLVQDREHGALYKTIE